MPKALPIEILGSVHGVRIEAGCGPGPCIRLLSEDDSFWGDTENHFDALWISDLIRVLERARQIVEEMKEGQEKAVEDHG